MAHKIEIKEQEDLQKHPDAMLFLLNHMSRHHFYLQRKAKNQNAENPLEMDETNIVLRPIRVADARAKGLESKTLSLADEVVISVDVLREWYAAQKNQAPEQLVQLTPEQLAQLIPEAYRDYFEGSFDHDPELQYLQTLRDDMHRQNPAAIQELKTRERLPYVDYHLKKATHAEAMERSDQIMNGIRNDSLQFYYLTPQQRVIMLPPHGKYPARYLTPADFDKWYRDLTLGKRTEIDQNPLYKEYFNLFSRKEGNKSFQSLVDLQNKHIAGSETTFTSNGERKRTSGFHGSAAPAQGLSNRATLPVSPAHINSVAQAKGWGVSEANTPNTNPDNPKSAGSRYKLVQDDTKQAAIKVYADRTGVGNPMTSEKAAMAAQLQASVPGTETITVGNNRDNVQALKTAFEAIIKAEKLPILESRCVPSKTQADIIAAMDPKAREDLNKLLEKAPDDVKFDYYNTTKTSPPDERPSGPKGP